MSHSAFVQNGFKLAIVFRGNQIGNSLAEIPQEAITGFGAFYNMSGKYRQPWRGIIAPQLFELLQHLVGPVLRAGFPAVVDDELDALLAHLIGANCFFIAVQILLEIATHIAPIQLVDFQTRCFLGCRMIRNAEQRISHPQNDPVTCRRRPVQRSVSAHFTRQIHHVGLANHV